MKEGANMRWNVTLGLVVVGAVVALTVLARDRRHDDHARAALPAAAAGEEVAIFAGGCFWCMEGPFEKTEGVSSATSGFTGGQTKDPTYEQVSAGGTGHAEAVRVVYDPRKV